MMRRSTSMTADRAPDPSLSSGPTTLRPDEERAQATEPTLSPGSVQRVFVGALLVVVLTVIATYMLGDFRGLNIGADFGLILAVTLLIALIVGLLAAAFHRRRSRDP